MLPALQRGHLRGPITVKTGVAQATILQIWGKGVQVSLELIGAHRQGRAEIVPQSFWLGSTEMEIRLYGSCHLRILYL